MHQCVVFGGFYYWLGGVHAVVVRFGKCDACRLEGGVVVYGFGKCVVQYMETRAVNLCAQFVIYSLKSSNRRFILSVLHRL